MDTETAEETEVVEDVADEVVEDCECDETETETDDYKVDWLNGKPAVSCW